MFPKHVVKIQWINVMGSLKIPNDWNACSCTFILSWVAGVGCKKNRTVWVLEVTHWPKHLFQPLHYLVLYFYGHRMNWPSKLFTCYKTPQKALKYRCVFCFWDWVTSPISVSAISFSENANILHFLPIQPALFHKKKKSPSSQQLAVRKHSWFVASHFPVSHFNDVPF